MEKTLLYLLVTTIVGILIKKFIKLYVGETPVEAPDQPSEPPSTSSNLQASINTFGEPDDIIVANPTKANDPTSTILIYRSKGMLVYDNIAIDKNAIVNISFHNIAIPYTPDNYEIVIKTTLKDHPEIYIHTGPDIAWTQNVINDLLHVFPLFQP